MLGRYANLEQPPRRRALVDLVALAWAAGAPCASCGSARASRPCPASRSSPPSTTRRRPSCGHAARRSRPRPSATGSCAWSTTPRRRPTCPGPRRGGRPPTPASASSAGTPTAASSPPPTTRLAMADRRVRRPARPRRRAAPRRPGAWSARPSTPTPEADYAYTDEDKIDEAGRRSGPFYKPDWSPERFRTQMYTCHLSVLRRIAGRGGRRVPRGLRGLAGLGPGAPGHRAGPPGRARARTCSTTGACWTTSTARPAARRPSPTPTTAGTRAIQAHCDRIGFPAPRRPRRRAPGRLPPAPRADRVTRRSAS